jgi:hypothetical protein
MPLAIELVVFELTLKLLPSNSVNVLTVPLEHSKSKLPLVLRGGDLHQSSFAVEFSMQELTGVG